ncbi:hypothetical protein [Bradyrhizobium monzae]|uniref:hypothetical protein n=1 Tax=Bradyrhizobium sp. Oc8 TaxID=2876780 RepID=UPI001F19E495|nr:hypothetical protein [Bradyrhizobium sp. Oc8]
MDLIVIVGRMIKCSQYLPAKQSSLSQALLLIPQQRRHHIGEFLSYLESDVPDFWTEIREVYDEIGFAEISIVGKFRELTASRFAVPEDLDCSTISAGIVEEMDRLFHFRMMRPENREKMWRLQEDWMAAKESMTFDEWRQSVQHGRKAK